MEATIAIRLLTSFLIGILWFFLPLSIKMIGVILLVAVVAHLDHIQRPFMQHHAVTDAINLTE